MPIEWLSGAGGAVLIVDGVGVLGVEVGGYDVVATQLLPHGPPWSRRSTSTTRRLAQALARTHARTDYANRRLELEASPATADEAIEEWETFAGITDPPAELADRQTAVVAKLFRSRGPLTLRGAEIIALGMGYTSIEFRRLYRPFRCGSKCGAKLAGSGTVAWQWHVLVVVTPSIPALDDQLRSILEEATQDHMTLHIRIS